VNQAIDAADLVFYVSGHGYGHATRCVALIAALRRISPGSLRIHVRSEAPHWIFQERDGQLACSAAAVDPGIIQSNALDVDLEATIDAHERFASRWEARLGEEAEFLRRLAPRVVVSDIPPLAIAAAAAAGISAVGVSNFSWDWILAGYAEQEPRLRPVVERYAEAYREADCVFRLPMHGDLGAFRVIVDVPLLTRRSRLPRTSVWKRLGISRDEGRSVVLISFGGFGGGPLASFEGADLAGMIFLAFEEKPKGFGGDWRRLPNPSPIPHEELVAACDAVIGKPGYSTAAEVLAHRTRFLYLSRGDYTEGPVLEAGLRRDGCARPIPRDDFFAGRWRKHLDALLAQPLPAQAPAANGAEVIATQLLEKM
jgi:UDP:flavonoid glycosyltransferase YjiC (YdhE family)